MKKNEPAFPQFDVVAGDRDGHGDAIEAYTTATGGMSLRDYFAGQALAGLCANPGGPFQACSQSGWRIVNCTPATIAEETYRIADAMIAFRPLPLPPEDS